MSSKVQVLMGDSHRRPRGVDGSAHPRGKGHVAKLGDTPSGDVMGPLVPQAT